MFPSKRQTHAFDLRGYVEAAASFEDIHYRFQFLCRISGKPLIVLWPAGKRKRNISMELSHCTDSILDENFRSAMKTLAKVWGAFGCQSSKLPVTFTGVSPRHARILAGYFHQMAIEAYERRAQRIKSILVVEGTPSDGKPIYFGTGVVLGTKDMRVLDCIIQLDNGERYRCVYKGVQEPKIKFFREEFATKPAQFTQMGTADSVQ